MRICDEIPSLEIVGAFRQEQKQNSGYGASVQLKYSAMSMRVRGQSCFDHNGVNIMSRENSVTYIPSFSPYKQRIETDSEILVVHFTSNNRLLESIACTEIADMKKRTEIKRLFEEMVCLYGMAELSSRARLYSAFYELLAMLMEIESQSLLPEHLPERADEIIRRNLGNADFSISDIAHELGISESYLRRLFFERYSVSPGKRLVGLRIKHSQELLESGFYSVAEASRLCGFSSSAYFSRVYKSITGKKPSELLY